MATYENPRTGVVHWVPGPEGWWDTPLSTTACHSLTQLSPSWTSDNFDPIGVPADVTCCKCRETAAFLDALQEAAEAEEK